MDTDKRTVEGFRALEEKFRSWKETHLPAGDISYIAINAQLNALGDKRLLAAYHDAEAGRAAERLLDVKGWVPMFSLAAGFCRGLLHARGIDVKTID